MGGNALKNCTTRRFDRNEFMVKQQHILNVLRSRFPTNPVFPITAYHNKPSFGDLDLIFQNSQGIDWNPVLYELFNPAEIVRNGHVISFECGGLQVDLILTELENMDSSLTYFAFNDLGNLMGRVSSRMGFKYGHKGLEYAIAEGTHKYSDILVSKDSAKIFEFLGYDFDRYKQGFDELQDVFEFAASSLYFNKDIYLYKNRNHKARVRDEKRKTYRDFLKWVENPPHPLPHFDWAKVDDRGGRVADDECLARATTTFPEFAVRLAQELAYVEKLKKSRSLLSGDLVRTWTGLDGEELGEFMKELRRGDGGKPMSPPEFVDFILSLGEPDNIQSLVCGYYDYWKEERSKL